MIIEKDALGLLYRLGGWNHGQAKPQICVQTSCQFTILQYETYVVLWQM